MNRASVRDSVDNDGVWDQGKWWDWNEDEKGRHVRLGENADKGLPKSVITIA